MRPLSWTPELGEHKGPIYLALADAMERDIRLGVLKEGDRLPPQRELSYALGVTVGTVTRAYAEAERRKLTKGEVGRGTYIHAERAEMSPLAQSPEDDNVLDLARNYPIHTLDPDLGEVLAVLSRDTNVSDLLRYTPPEGLIRHRAAGAAWCKRFGLDVPPERVLVTNGAQHAIQILMQGLLRPGDAVAVDAVTFPGFIGPAARLNVRLVPITLDDDGMDPIALEQACTTQHIRALFVMPGAQNPTTITMPLARREAIAEIARRYDLAIIEDDPYAPLLEEVLPPFGMLVPERTYNACSTSKVLAAGLRIGYLAVPEKHVRSLAARITDTSWMAPPLLAEVSSRWIEDGTGDRLAQARRAETTARYHIAKEIFHDYAFKGAPDKLYLWLPLPDGLNAAQVEQDAAASGVKCLSSTSFQVTQSVPVAPALRITLGAVASQDHLRSALTTLRGCIDRAKIYGGLS